MKYGVYAIKDSVTGFLTPTVDSSDNSAMRNFHHATSRPESLMYFRANDFDLYRIGTYDTESGKIESFDSPEFVCHAYKKRSRKSNVQVEDLY